MVENGAFSHKIGYVQNVQENINLEGNLNHCIRSKVTAILVNEGILPRGGVALERVYPEACAAGLFYMPYPKTPSSTIRH